MSGMEPGRATLAPKHSSFCSPTARISFWLSPFLSSRMAFLRLWPFADLWLFLAAHPQERMLFNFYQRWGPRPLLTLPLHLVALEVFHWCQKLIFLFRPSSLSFLLWALDLQNRLEGLGQRTCKTCSAKCCRSWTTNHSDQAPQIDHWSSAFSFCRTLLSILCLGSSESGFDTWLGIAPAFSLSSLRASRYQPRQSCSFHLWFLILHESGPSSLL